MNLVAKEMMVCNPAASLVLSSEAGTKGQPGNAGFYSEDKNCYHRVDDIADTETKQMADFYMPMTQTAQIRRQIVEVVLKKMRFGLTSPLHWGMPRFS
ncbi:hypothetical protein ANCCAN_28093 [Ancylostoma caninum]|uniref:Uncharacterized protein n=1 Tax=Ancylostoma caninum TaxID=29170 RepID=A0A368F265_ANCCA|nr:hypothetical protein ANCCAN_28093 [Ancylostoma caninum]